MEALTKISPEDYLAQEAEAEQKHEYKQGEVYAMEGVQPPHNQLANNLIFLLNQYL